MELPVYENERPAGELRSFPQGPYTVFEARLPPATGLTRLWLADGAGGAAPLGLLEPRGEGRFLLRRLSRLELRALPPRPAFALALPADASPPAPVIANQSADWCGNPHPPSRKEQTDCRVGLRPPRNDMGEESVAWRRLPDGTLLDPARRLLALPWAGGPLPPPARKISLAGREYWLFRY